MVGYFTVQRRLALHRAEKALLPDQEAYDKVWDYLKVSQIQELREMQFQVEGHHQRKISQPIGDFAQLYMLGEELNEWYQSLVESWAEHLQIKHIHAPLKRVDRAHE